MEQKGERKKKWCRRVTAVGAREGGIKGVQRDWRKKKERKTRDALYCVAAPGCCFHWLPGQPQEKADELTRWLETLRRSRVCFCVFVCTYVQSSAAAVMFRPFGVSGDWWWVTVPQISYSYYNFFIFHQQDKKSWKNKSVASFPFFSVSL